LSRFPSAGAELIQGLLLCLIFSFPDNFRCSSLCFCPSPPTPPWDITFLACPYPAPSPFYSRADEQRTPTIDNNQNPDWTIESLREQSTFRFFVHDRDTQQLQLIVYDEDPHRITELGRCAVAVNQLEENKVVILTRALQGDEHGELTFRIGYRPFDTAGVLCTAFTPRDSSGILPKGGSARPDRNSGTSKNVSGATDGPGFIEPSGHRAAVFFYITSILNVQTKKPVKMTVLLPGDNKPWHSLPVAPRLNTVVVENGGEFFADCDDETTVTLQLSSRKGKDITINVLEELKKSGSREGRLPYNGRSFALQFPGAPEKVHIFFCIRGATCNFEPDVAAVEINQKPDDAAIEGGSAVPQPATGDSADALARSASTLSTVSTKQRTAAMAYAHHLLNRLPSTSHVADAATRTYLGRLKELTPAYAIGLVLVVLCAGVIFNAKLVFLSLWVRLAIFSLFVAAGTWFAYHNDLRHYSDVPETSGKFLLFDSAALAEFVHCD
jgi:hypothetical protein